MRPFVAVVLFLLIGCGDSFQSGTDASSGAGAGDPGGGGGRGPVDPIGCSDGTRETYDDPGEPNIAGCQGAFDMAGTKTTAADKAQCDRKAGNDGANADGAGCSIQDLCSAGWHVCRSAQEVGDRAASGACPAVAIDTFWLTRDSLMSVNPETCAPDGTNNLVGCGNFPAMIMGGGTLSDASCQPLNAWLGYTGCMSVPGWYCGATADSSTEGLVVTKIAAGGGVLCCRD